jgi:hypothetical protein
MVGRYAAGTQENLHQFSLVDLPNAVNCGDGAQSTELESVNAQVTPPYARSHRVCQKVRRSGDAATAGGLTWPKAAWAATAFQVGDLAMFRWQSGRSFDRLVSAKWHSLGVKRTPPALGGCRLLGCAAQAAGLRAEQKMRVGTLWAQIGHSYR